MSITCYLLSPRGFCSGVSRAVNMVNQVLKLYGTVYMTEDVIHNKVFIKEIMQKGIVKVDSLNEISDGSVVMFSAHGVSPELVNIAEKKQLTIIDATCPIVKVLQHAVKDAAESGKKIIIIGNRSHPEIVGLTGCAGNRDVYVVYNEMDIDLLPDFVGDEVVYFTQTTLDSYVIDEIIDNLKKKIPHIKSDSSNNICFATKERQAIVKIVAGSCDLFIVAGSKYSSNASRLAEIASDFGAKKVMQVDSEEEIDLNNFDNIKTMAITSASSTPEFVVDKIKNFLSNNLDITFEDYSVDIK